MRYIANILTKGKFDDIDFFNIVHSESELIEGIPTLIIGWEFTKSLYPNANILSWEIDDNTYWVFGKREKRQRFDETFNSFKKLAFNRFIKKIKYKYFNVLTESDKNSTSLEFLLDYCNGLNIYINNDMIYVSNICNENEYYVYGYSIRDYEYLGFDRKNIFNKIFKSGVKIINDKDITSWDIKNVFKNHKYAIPCLF